MKPCCDKSRGLPRHCCCHELCCGLNGCGERHNIKHLPLLECTDKKKYRKGQRRRHSRCFYCYRNVGNWLTLLFVLIGLGGAIAALALYLAPCTPDYHTYLANVTSETATVSERTVTKYDGANVMLMLDCSGSIQDLWTDEIDSAEQVLDIFKTNLHPQTPFRAGAVRWGSDAEYMNTLANGKGTDTKLSPDIADTRAGLTAARSNPPSGSTYFMFPFYYFYREIMERSTGAVDTDPNNKHHNFMVFITDGVATDYKALKGNGKDVPFSGDYTISTTDAAVNDGICKPKGFDCAATNVIR